MTAVSAQLSNYRQAPRKVRIVADLVRGKHVVAALAELDFLAKRAGEPMSKLIKSAIANAENLNISKEHLIVKEIQVDQGVTLKRSMPRARGRAFPIMKRCSHIVVVLDEGTTKPSKKVARSSNTKTEAKKTNKKEVTSSESVA